MPRSNWTTSKIINSIRITSLSTWWSVPMPASKIIIWMMITSCSLTMVQRTQTSLIMEKSLLATLVSSSVFNRASWLNSCRNCNSFLTMRLSSSWITSQSVLQSMESVFRRRSSMHSKRRPWWSRKPRMDHRMPSHTCSHRTHCQLIQWLSILSQSNRSLTHQSFNQKSNQSKLSRCLIHQPIRRIHLNSQSSRQKRATWTRNSWARSSSTSKNAWKTTSRR